MMMMVSVHAGGAARLRRQSWSSVAMKVASFAAGLGVILMCVSEPASAQFSQQGTELFGTGATSPPEEGYSVSLSADGNTAIVGGPTDAGAIGAAWIFARSGGVWAQQGQKLVGTGNAGASAQGTGVAMSGDGNTAPDRRRQHRRGVDLHARQRGLDPAGRQARCDQPDRLVTNGLVGRAVLRRQHGRPRWAL
jgi:hypothetical protein